MQLNPYITFNGNCEAAMNFYNDVLNGEINILSRFSEMPEEVCLISDQDKDLIMHCTLDFDGGRLMASDTIEPEKLKIGSNCTLSVSIADEDEGSAVYNSLAEGGQSIMPFNDAFWGGKFGMLIDKFGMQWMVSSDHKSV